MQARVRPEKTPRHSSQSLGAVGSMQAPLQKQVRTLKTDLETKIKSHLLTSMAVWPWLARHSAWLVERYQMRTNGRTSYRDCFGTIYTGIVLRFGEQAVCRHPVGTAAGRNRQTFKQLRKEKAAKKMDLGIWLGKTYETDEHYMGMSSGIFTARSCRRMPSDGQWKLDHHAWHLKAQREQHSHQENPTTSSAKSSSAMFTGMYGRKEYGLCTLL